MDNPQSVFAEALRVSWANIQLAIDHPRSTAPRERRPGIALGITSAVSGEGKSLHALALARAAALAGEDVVLVDADLRRCGVSRLLDKNFRFTLKDFLQERCTAEDAIAVEKRSGVHFVPGAPIGTALTSQALGQFFNLIQHLKQRFAIIIIDFPPILGLAETIRLAMAADGLALVIRWGRTERQSVQFAFDTLRTASVSTIGVILNDIDLKASRRRGYRDHTAMYTDKRLYSVEPGYQEPVTPATLSAQAAKPDAPSETSRPNRGQRKRRLANNTLRRRPSKNGITLIMVNNSVFDTDHKRRAAPPLTSVYPADKLDGSAARTDAALLVAALFLPRFSLPVGNTALLFDLLGIGLILLYQFFSGKLLIQYDRLLWFLFFALTMTCSLLFNFKSTMLTSYAQTTGLFQSIYAYQNIHGFSI